MKILIMDGHTLFQKDIDRSPLQAFGEVSYLDRFSRNHISEYDPETSVLITNNALVGVPELDYFRQLKLVIVTATGYNCVDVNACNEKGIPVCNVPAYGTYSVAQHALAMLLEYSNQVGLHNNSVQQGAWAACPDFSYTLTPISEWYGKTLGIIGMGNIGSCFAGMAESLGMQVIYSHTRDLMLSGRKFVDLDTLAASADVISLHCPLNAQTDKIIGTDFLSKMKPGAVLVNTSRGGLIDNQALQKTMQDGSIAAALLDVLDHEPPPADLPLIGLPNVFITPHIAWISFEARQRIFEVIKTAISSFNSGQLINRVN
jgi:glycerate dehydrogenase